VVRIGPIAVVTRAIVVALFHPTVCQPLFTPLITSLPFIGTPFGCWVTETYRAVGAGALVRITLVRHLYRIALFQISYCKSIDAVLIEVAERKAEAPDGC
jgi:hypothetical protein